MNSSELLAISDRLLERLDIELARGEKARLPGLKAEVVEFLRLYGGPKNSFVTAAETPTGGYEHTRLRTVRDVLAGFRSFVEAGLHNAISPVRRAELDVVSDFLGQAQALLLDPKVHPAAPAVLIGASLEEFLRTWAEAVPLSIGSRKPGLQAYCDVLRDADLLTKQDVKDITSWAGVRNDAAHGNWAAVNDPERVRLVLEGVNLFMRKYGA